MDSSLPQAEPAPLPQPRWQALSARDRRVAGVLIEKAKTTPDQYPMSLVAVRTACNQKNNRDPQMELEIEQVQEALDRLRALGAVSLVQAGGRVERYRHQLYDWLGVDKVELAVMAELLLRGAQTEGELRGRASRMEPINDLETLRAILDRLASKNLIVSLTPPGRGHIVTHNLYQPEELQRLRARYAGPRGGDFDAAESAEERFVAPRTRNEAPPTSAKDGDLEELRHQLAALREETAQLRARIDELAASVEESRRDLRELRVALGA
jgi:uncharacterized protein YceH (UPF0502 family)